MSTQSMSLTSLLLAGALAAQAQPQPATPYRPTQEEILQRYRSVAQLDTQARNTVLKSFVMPVWQADQKTFWYRNNLKDNTSEYIYVDAAAGKKGPAFDHAQLAAALSKAAGKTIDPAKLGISSLVIDNKTKQVSFRLQNQWYRFDPAQQSCTSIASPDTLAGNSAAMRRRNRWERDGRRDSTSPDKQWVSFIKDYNVYIRPAGSQEAFQYTSDGTKEKPYGQLTWSPDSKYAIGYKIDPREAKEVYYILTSQPNTMRGQLKSQRYAQPGDEFTSFEMYTFNMASKKAVKVNTEKYDFLGSPSIRWRKDNRYFTYEKADRGHQRFRIIEVDSETGNTRNVIDEKTNTFIYEQRIFTHYLPETEEIIWSSEKDGYRHLYLVDMAKGTVKNAITTGDWVVREIDSIDEKKREIWFRASGMQAGEDPYNLHYYRIGFDGKKLASLTPAVGNHNVSWSPDRKYFVDTYSSPAVAPVTTLNRTADGKPVMELEKADISGYLALGVPLPEVFVAKARDGKTDIWGVVCRPRNFDPNKRYPVIENIYAGPQDAFVPKSFMSYGEMQSMAELGFIVVQCDGMGTANRSKAFHDVCWQNLADAVCPTASYGSRPWPLNTLM
ncbi:S9 family peptidase [Paraflavitalea pollutisoli]|uniref:S9 family peptidase n=1 Tax=Paraflavitalea pollutisoli TaxID=3034143 RepID=UPI0023EE130E|nr:DPP IV N-terminal domain-containing protein [Paraflavitalea sp. H1-2-19X]